MKTALVTLIAFCLSILVACGGEVVEDDSVVREVTHAQGNIVDLMKDEIEEVWNSKNLDLYAEYYSTSLKAQFNDDPKMNYQGHYNYLYALFNDLPDLQVTLLDIFSKGSSKLVKRYRITGTHLGGMMGFPPTGKKISFTGTGIYKFSKGKIKELWNHYDMYGILQQMGYAQ